MRERDFDASVDAGRELGRLAGNCECPGLLHHAQATLDGIVARLVVHSPEDAAAAAIIALAEGMLAVLETAEQDFDWLAAEIDSDAA